MSLSMLGAQRVLYTLKPVQDPSLGGNNALYLLLGSSRVKEVNQDI